MTALDDIIRLADAVLDERVSDLTVRIRAQQAAPDLARALKAAAEALEDEGPPPLGVIYGPQYCAAYGDAVRSIRAAIERRLVLPEVDK